MKKERFLSFYIDFLFVRRSRLLLLFTFLIAIPSFGQQKLTEPTEVETTKLAELRNYIQWSVNYGRQKQFDSANKYTERALHLASKLNTSEAIITAELNHAKLLYWQTKSTKAKEYLTNILKREKLQDSLRFQARMLFTAINAYEQDYKSALENTIAAQGLLEKKGLENRNDSLNMMDVYLNMAEINQLLGNSTKALSLYDDALDYNEDAGYESYILYNKGSIYSKEDNLEQAIQYTLKALEGAKRAKAKVYLPTYYLALSEYYLTLKKGDSAIYYATSGLADNTDCHLDGLRNNAGLGFVLQGDLPKAVSFFNAALAVDQIEIPQTEVHKNLRDTYIKQKRFEKALYHNEQYLRLKDSIDALNMRQEVLEITEKFESDKKELEIEILSAENNFHTIIIAKQRNQLILIGLTLALVLILLGLISWFFIKQKRQKQFLYRKTEQLARELRAKERTPLEEKISAVSKKESLGIDTARKKELIVSIEQLIDNTFYLDKDMTLSKMAKMMETNTSYLSKFVNENYQKSFANFINDLRISHTLQKLESKAEYKDLTIEHIADKAGFASSSAFYSAFKKFTGLTPSYYIKQKLLHTA